MADIVGINIDGLESHGSPGANDKLIIRDKATNKDKSISVATLLGSATQSSIPDWDKDTVFNTTASKYAIEDDRIWRSLQDGNQNHRPSSDDPETPVWWVEVSRSVGSAIREHANGIYAETDVIVKKNGILYELTSAIRPYESVDFNAELEAGDWEAVGGAAKKLTAFTGPLNLSKVAGTYYEQTYDLAQSGTPNWSIASGAVPLGRVYMNILSDGITPIGLEPNLNSVFTNQYGVPDDRILPAGLYEVHIMKTPIGATIEIPAGEGGSSSPTQLTTPILTATAQDGAVRIVWTNEDAAATGRELLRSTTNDIITASAVAGYDGSADYVDDNDGAGLTNGTTYYHWGRNTASGYTSSLYASDSATPVLSGVIAPTIDSITPYSYEALITYTSNNVDPLEEYNIIEVSRQSDYSVIDEIRMLPVGSGSVYIGALLPSTDYYFRMKAKSLANGDSGYVTDTITTSSETALSAQLSAATGTIQDAWIADEHIVSGDGINVDSVNSSGSLATVAAVTTTKPTINNDVDGTGRKAIVIDSSNQKLNVGATYPISGSKRHFWAVCMYKSTGAPHIWWNANYWRIKKLSGGQSYTGDYFLGPASKNIDSRINKLDIVFQADDNASGTTGMVGSMGDVHIDGSYPSFLSNVQSYIGYDGSMEVAATVVGSSTTANSALMKIYNSLSNYYKLTDRTNHKFVAFFGDSIFNAIKVGDTVNAAPAKTMTSLRTTYTGEQFQYLCYAGSGWTLANQINGGTGRMALRYYMGSHNFGLGNKCAVVLIGTNDLAGATTESELMTLMTAYVNYINQFFDKIIICTILPRPTVATKIANFNTLLKNYAWPSWVSIVDLAADPSLDDNTDTTYYDVDAIHPNAAGHTAIFNLIKPAVETAFSLI